MAEEPVENVARPLVVVVTPVYNGDAYLEATMRCVQEQSYDSILHVVVDNCSTDLTPNIIEKFRHQRCQVVSVRNQETLPVAENWKRAIQVVPSGAKYVKFLCADDLMRRDCIQRFVEIAEFNREVQVVLCDDVVGNRVHRANLPETCQVFDGVEVVRGMLDTSISWLPYHHLFMRFCEEDRTANIFGSIPIFFDAFAVMNCVLRGKLAYIHEPLVFTRWHPDSITSKHLQKLTPLLSYFDTFTTFGRQCWCGSAYEKELERACLRLRRVLLKAIFRGNKMEAQLLTNGLRQRGVGLSVTDYARSLADWLPYALWKRRWKQPLGAEISEESFR
jgi:glycosyltransferase involved in cell wall biosynthesis